MFFLGSLIYLFCELRPVCVAMRPHSSQNPEGLGFWPDFGVRTYLVLVWRQFLVPWLRCLYTCLSNLFSSFLFWRHRFQAGNFSMRTLGACGIQEEFLWVGVSGKICCEVSFGTMVSHITHGLNPPTKHCKAFP